MVDPNLFQADTMMAAAGAAGASGAALVNRSNDTNLRKAGEALAGSLVAIFGGPGVADLIGVQQENIRVLASLILGALGYSLLTMLIDWAKGGGLRAWLSRYVNVPPTPPNGPTARGK